MRGTSVDLSHVLNITSRNSTVPTVRPTTSKKPLCNKLVKPWETEQSMLLYWPWIHWILDFSEQIQTRRRSKWAQCRHEFAIIPNQTVDVSGRHHLFSILFLESREWVLGEVCRRCHDTILPYSQSEYKIRVRVRIRICLRWSLGTRFKATLHWSQKLLDILLFAQTHNLQVDPLNKTWSQRASRRKLHT